MTAGGDCGAGSGKRSLRRARLPRRRLAGLDRGQRGGQSLAPAPPAGCLQRRSARRGRGSRGREGRPGGPRPRMAGRWLLPACDPPKTRGRRAGTARQGEPAAPVTPSRCLDARSGGRPACPTALGPGPSVARARGASRSGAGGCPGGGRASPRRSPRGEPALASGARGGDQRFRFCRSLAHSFEKHLLNPRWAPGSGGSSFSGRDVQLW